jgi:hypothetical protein
MVFSVREKVWWKKLPWEASSDKFSVWAIRPGGRILREGNLYSGINGFIEEGGCTPFRFTKCDLCVGTMCCVPAVCYHELMCSGSDQAGPGPGDGTVGGEAYEDPPTSDVDENQCGPSDCVLLEENEYGYYFRPKYELLCDDDGYWNVCYNGTVGTVVEIGPATYRCLDDFSWLVSLDAF